LSPKSHLSVNELVAIPQKGILGHLDATSLVANAASGNLLSAAVDAGALLVDVAEEDSIEMREQFFDYRSKCGFAICI
jgi:hypothetical protein